MSLSETEISRIDALLAAIGNEVEPAVLEHALRQLVPDLPCRQCDASDVLEEPFRSAAQADIHLLDTRDHCVRVTGDPAEASALLIGCREAV